MGCVSPSQSVLRRHTEWELLMREKEQKKSVFGSGEDIKENKQVFAEKPLSCCTMDACLYWPAVSILLHKGE